MRFFYEDKNVKGSSIGFRRFKFAMIVILALLGTVCVFAMTYNLCKRSERVQTKLIAARKVLNVQKTVFFFIPAGSEHYFVGEDESHNLYLIRSSNIWYNHNFDMDGNAKDGICYIDLPVRSCGSNLRTPMEDILSELSSYFPYGIYSYLDGYYVFFAVYGLIFTVFVMLSALLISYGVLLFPPKHLFGNKDGKFSLEPNSDYFENNSVFASFHDKFAFKIYGITILLFVIMLLFAR